MARISDRPAMPACLLLSVIGHAAALASITAYTATGEVREPVPIEVVFLAAEPISTQPPPTVAEPPPVPAPIRVSAAPAAAAVRIMRPVVRPVVRPAAKPALKPVVRPPDFALGSPHNPAPDYPHRARVKGWQGRVVLRVSVDPEGTPLKVAVAHSSGHPILDTAAHRTVANWRFQPATRSGRPVAGEAVVPVVFRLN